MHAIKIMLRAAVCFLLCFICPAGIIAQEVISIYDGPAPGSEEWDWNEAETTLNGDAIISYNVSHPALTVFSPNKSVATGTAVIICPGGGFHFLSMQSEGYDVAHWLNGRGITAFVLKYRLVRCMTDNPMMEFIGKGPNTEKFNRDIEPLVAMAIEDGKQAITYVRSHAAEFGISSEKIGIMGFSAGGTVAAGVAYTYDPGSRPGFAAPVYPYVGSFGTPPVPPDAPPLFIVAASDDIFGFNRHCIQLYTEWIDANKSAELHIYEKGGHGFGMNNKDLPVDTWIERFHDWLLSLE